MSDFSVNINSLTNASESFKREAESINAISSEVSSILKQTKSSANSWIVDVAADYYIKKCIEACAGDMNKLATKITEIAELYIQSEKFIQDRNFRETLIYINGFANDGFVNFDDYSLTDLFLDDRNETKDAVLFALTRDLTEGLSSLIKREVGLDDFNDEIYKDTILRMLNHIEKKRIDLSPITETLDIIDSTVANPMELTDNFLKVVDGEGYSDSLKGLSGAALKNLGDLLAMGKDGVEIVELYMNDYLTTIIALEDMKKGLQQVNGSQRTIDYINELIDSYNNKFETSLNNVCETAIDIGVDKTLDATINTATGGLFGFVDSSQGFIWDAMGLSEKGDCLGSVYASYQYSDDLVASYNYYAQKLQSGNYTESDVQMCKTMFEMARQARIDEYTYMQRLVGKDDKAILNEEINKLENLKWNSGATI